MAYHSWSKHATLINNCYPTAPDELNPKSNELSYLVFYANSKPAKLTKCGIHLEKRVASDVKKRKKQDIDVSLQIISKLLGACKKDLNLFSKNVVKIIADSLSTKDIELVARACSVFIDFCLYHDGTNLGVDSEFTTIYERLHALQAAVTSDALYKAKSKHQFQQIIPALLKNLTDDEIGLEHLQKIEMEENNNNSDGHSKPNQFSINSTTISAEQNARLAYNCYKQVFKYANTSNINMSLNPTFAFLDDNNLWLPSSFGISLAFVVISSLQPVFRHTLVTKIIQELNSLINVAESLPKKFTLIEMLTSILTNKVNLVNYSIIEVLGCLLRHLLNSVKLRDQNLEVANLNSDEKASVAETSLIKKSAELEEMNAQRLFTCIGISISDSRKTLLKCLDTVLKKNNESKKLYPEYPRNEIQIETFQKTTGLCSDAKSKHQFQQIIPALLKNLTDDEIGLEHLQKIEMEENNNNSDGHSKPNQFSINSTTISAEQNARLAYNCYKQVFKYANTSNINMSLNPTFAFLDDNNLWLPSSFGISLAFVVISSLQPVFRHTLVTKIIQELNSLINVAESLPKKFTLIEMLTSILTNKVNLVNYSIIEVLGCLLRHLLNSVKLRDQNLEVANLNSDEKASVAETSLIKKSAELEEMNAQRLFTCIGISISDSRKTLLKCLDTVLKKNNESKKLYPEYPRNEIQIETFQKTTGLCSDDDHEVRIAYAQITTYFKQPSIHFLNSLHLSLYQFLLSQKSTPQDYITLSTILRALFNRFHVDQVICGVPVVFKLQLENYTRQRALASIIVLYFYDIATGLKISELQDYIKKEISNKPNQLLQPVDIWLDHQIIVPLLCKHKELTDIGGKQLEENLMAEWNPEEGFERLKCEVSKIRSSRILGNEKPHFAITPPIFTHHEDSSGDLPKPTIKVENLRDALVVQQLVSNDASEHENSVVSDLESINYSWNSVNGKKEKKTPQKDTIAFLSSLSSIDTIKSASARLINPPYES
ncbi:6300_t:CDS:10 [Entrophospora sp. SA101]|nr:6300_t:CDS:10 [Entrophospora sp. SA101]